MSILTEKINNTTHVFTGKAVVKEYSRSTALTLPLVALLDSAGLSDTALLHFNATVRINGSNSTMTGAVRVGETATATLSGGIVGSFTYNSNGLSASLSADTLQGFSVPSLKIGNTASLNSNTDVIFAEGDWAAFPYDINTSVGNHSYTIPIYREQGSGLVSGQLKSPYWFPLQITIKVGSNDPRRGFWDFALGCYIEEGQTPSTSTYLGRMEWNTLRIRTSISNSSTIVITGSHWVAVCPNVAYAPPKLAGYNKGLLSYSGRLLIHRRDYTTSGTSCLGNTDTRYINNCYSASQVGWNLGSHEHSKINISSSAWGETVLSGTTYTSTNGFAAPSPYWESAQPAQGIITDPVTTMALKSENAVAAIEGVFYSRYSNLIPMFIHAYTPNVEASVYWESNSDANPIVSVAGLASHTYIKDRQIVGANGETCMLYAYNSDTNILSFSEFEHDGIIEYERCAAIESAICGDLDNNIEFYINNKRYCIKYNAGDTWTICINKSNNLPFNLRHYGINIEVSQGKVLISNLVLVNSDGDEVYGSDAIISGEHYSTHI